MIKFIKNLFQSSLNTRQIKQTEPVLEEIKEWREKLEDKTFDDFKSRVTEMKKEIRELVDEIPEEKRQSIVKIDRANGLPEHEIEIQEKLQEFLPEVYAMLDAIYKRKTGNGYFDVQLQAGVILSQGQRLVEQYTGEGKTRTFMLPLALYALAGRGSHLVTVNDYLTKVGGEYAGHLLSELGLTVGINIPGKNYKFIPDDQLEKYKGEEILQEREEQSIDIDKMHEVNLVECTKRQAYECDVLYSTNNELGFDYLRDNMAWNLNRLVQRELYFCIVDEADSILIDEARTPLIISATPSDADTEKYQNFAGAVANLEEETHYEVDHKQRSVTLTEEGMEQVERNLGVDNIWKDYSMAFHLENALKAKALFTRGDQYMVRRGQVFIVDEFTGRVLEGRRYSEGLHQAIEAKENVEIKQESKTFATITFQNLFRLYKVLCGGSGTILTEAEEFFKIYGLESVAIPTNKPRIRIDHPDRIYKTVDAKFRAVVADVIEQNEIGRPILIGTTSVDNSELVSKYLDKAGIRHEVLNAKYHEQESRIVAEAGKKGAVTVATNMAGRGTDIVIGGGTRGDDAWQEIADLGGLYVIGTERHDARRIDNQLRGRTGRQGEPGETRFYVSMEDKIMRILGGDILGRLMGAINVDDDTPIELGMITKQIESAQKRIEGVNFDSRKRLVDYDDVMSQHREIFYQRRKNIMIAGEHADGKFIEEGSVIDINLPEHKGAVEKYKDDIEKSVEKLKQMAEEYVAAAIHITTEEALNLFGEDRRDDAIANINELVPIAQIAERQNVSKNKVQKDIQTWIEDEDPESIESLLTETFEEKLSEFENDASKIIKMLNLEVLDNKWVEHLEVMKGLREGVGLSGYAQRDPLVEYKNKAFGMFESFIENVNLEVAERLFRVTKVDRTAAEQPTNLQTNQDEVEDILTGSREMTDGESEVRSDKLLGDIERAQKRTSASLKTNDSASNTNKTVTNDLKEYGRNDRVTVKYADGTEKKNVKFKKVQADVESGKASIV